MKETELKDHRLTVALRIRPFSEAEQKEGAAMVAYRVDEQTMVHLDPLDDPANALHAKGRDRERSFSLDMVFDDSASQEEVYRATTSGLIEGLISGYNATVFAYGPTGCGKTYTMLGTEEEPGIYFRMLNDLFRAIEDTSDDMLYSVSMSYLEIYNEMIRDLLNPISGVLELREDGKGGIQVAGITEMSTVNAREILELLTLGNMERTEESTAANKSSSRSHAVLQVTVTQQNRSQDIKQEVRFGRLFMIDLAGSERAAQTQNTGLRLKEGAHINLSLLALGNCINALSGKCGTKFVNFRDSKLTRLLKDSLCGNCRTVMIAHISPASTAFDESRNTLFYAERAKTIKLKVKKNLMNVPPSNAQYTNIIAELRNEIVRLRKQLADQAILTDRADIRHVQAEVQAHSTQQTQTEMDQLKTQLLDAFRQQMDVKKDLTDLENRNIQIESNASKHMLTIVDWEQEQKQRKRKWLTEKMKESVNKDESEMESDSVESPPDIAQETQEVAMARESLGTLMNKQKKIHKQKKSLERKFLEIRIWTRQLEQQLPQRLISEEQREVLSLLCKVHELEITNAEMLKDNVILHKKFLMQRFEEHRHLCDEIIQQQRRFIDNHSLHVPSHLQELYVVYLRELGERKVDRAVCLEPSRQTIKEGSLPKITFPSQCPDNIQDMDSDQESIRNMCSDNGRGRTESRRHIFPPIFPQPELDNNRVFKNSPLTEHMKKAVMTPPPLHTNRKSNRELRPLATVSSLSYSRLVHSVSSRMGSSPESSEAGADAPAARTEIVKGVNCLTYTTTCRRSKAEVDALLLPVAPSPPDLKKQKSSFSKMEAPPRGRLPNPGLRHATSDDNLSCSTIEAPVHANNRLVAAKNQTPRKAGFKGLKKRRSQSFEVNGQALPQTKMTTALKLCPLDSASDLHLHSNAQAVPLRPQQRGVPPGTKVRALRNRQQAEPSTAHTNNPRRPPLLQPQPIGFSTSVAGVQRTRRH